MPPDFSFPDSQTMFWVPLVQPVSGPAMLARRSPIARLRDEVTIQAASEEVNAVLPRLITQSAASSSPPAFPLVRVQDQLADPLRQPLTVVASAIGFVLLIACAN